MQGEALFIVAQAPQPYESDDDDSDPLDPGAVEMSAYPPSSNKGNSFCEESLAALRTSVQTTLQDLGRKVRLQVEKLEILNREGEEQVLLYRLTKRKYMSDLKDEHAKIQRMCHQLYQDVIHAANLDLSQWVIHDGATAMQEASPHRLINVLAQHGVYDSRRNPGGRGRPVLVPPELPISEATPQRPVYRTPQCAIYATPQYIAIIPTQQHAIYAPPQSALYATPQSSGSARTSQHTINEATQRSEIVEPQSPVASFKAALSKKTAQHVWPISYVTAECKQDKQE